MDMFLLNDGDIFILFEIKEVKIVKIFIVIGEEIKYFVYVF